MFVREVCYHAPTLIGGRWVSSPRLHGINNPQALVKMNYLRFVSNKNQQPTQEKIVAATTISDFAQIIEASKAIAEYIFEESEDANKLFRSSSSVKMERVPVGKTGNEKNRIICETSKGRFFLRVYGIAKGVLEKPKEYTKEEIKKLRFGFCTSDGEKVTEQRYNPKTGEVQNIPVLYCSIAK